MLTITATNTATASKFIAVTTTIILNITAITALQLLLLLLPLLL